MAKKKELSYDAAIKELDDIMEKLQDENVGLDKMADYVQRASELIKYCKDKLRGIQANVDQIFEEDE